MRKIHREVSTNETVKIKTTKKRLKWAAFMSFYVTSDRLLTDSIRTIFLIWKYSRVIASDALSLRWGKIVPRRKLESHKIRDGYSIPTAALLNRTAAVFLLTKSKSNFHLITYLPRAPPSFVLFEFWRKEGHQWISTTRSCVAIIR